MKPLRAQSLWPSVPYSNMLQLQSPVCLASVAESELCLGVMHFSAFAHFREYVFQRSTLHALAQAQARKHKKGMMHNP